MYDQACPNVDAARAQIRDALAQLALPISWQEWDRDAPETPVTLRPYGSPTILVDGWDVAGEPASETSLPVMNSCRVYIDPVLGVRGVPEAALIVTALQRAGPGISPPRSRPHS